MCTGAFHPALVATMLIAGAAVPGWAADLPYQGGKHIMVDPSDLDWKPVASMAPGAQIAIIEGDLSKKGEPFTMRLKLPANYRVAPHTHPEYERVTVLSGTFHFAHGDTFEREKARALEPGAVAIMPPGAPMFGYTEEETVIQLHGTAPWGITYVNPKDDPRKQ